MVINDKINTYNTIILIFITLSKKFEEKCVIVPNNRFNYKTIKIDLEFVNNKYGLEFIECWKNTKSIIFFYDDTKCSFINGYKVYNELKRKYEFEKHVSITSLWKQKYYICTWYDKFLGFDTETYVRAINQVDAIEITNMTQEMICGSVSPITSIKQINLSDFITRNQMIAKRSQYKGEK